eukprot:CAMPEP_0198230448 /NCGR_PEP_ID=MMETSP1445-20131203/114668_1 /TAXON_ID=36898 /ORGANISM="Pyramimonas sp., Strain CCMP2087" /LENGTH=84 /DNA_ID=CAMNT_0043910989 /DNA_START=372 /DNA_END=626 /DNA_ORIENTATION=+
MTSTTSGGSPDLAGRGHVRDQQHLTAKGHRPGDRIPRKHIQRTDPPPLSTRREHRQEEQEDSAQGASAQGARITVSQEDKRGHL